MAVRPKLKKVNVNKLSPHEWEGHLWEKLADLMHSNQRVPIFKVQQKYRKILYKVENWAKKVEPKMLLESGGFKIDSQSFAKRVALEFLKKANFDNRIRSKDFANYFKKSYREVLKIRNLVYKGNFFKNWKITCEEFSTDFVSEMKGKLKNLAIGYVLRMSPSEISFEEFNKKAREELGFYK